tara:strand:+ start:110 stop:856 length:747 start_codon:yes stop_codon:yes gene_type:complete
MSEFSDAHIEAAINDFAIRCFRDTADRDYIHARLAYCSSLIPQFRWSALHCLEKYGKCILLLNRISSKGVRHNVSQSLAKLKASGKFDIELSDQSKAFMVSLERNAQYRYLETSYYSMPGDLHALDKAVWEIRRYCQVMEYEIETPSGPKDLFRLVLEGIHRAKERGQLNSSIISGWLENVIKKNDHPARKALIWNNPFFGKVKRNTFRMRVHSESVNAPLQLHPEILDEVLKYVFVPKALINELQGS